MCIDANRQKRMRATRARQVGQQDDAMSQLSVCSALCVAKLATLGAGAGAGCARAACPAR